MTMKTELKTPRLRTFYIKQEADEDVVFTLRMARTPDGFTIYAKSKEFHDWFKNLSKNTTLGFTKAWAVNMDSYNISKLWTDRMYDDLGGQINWRDPEDYIPKTLEAGFRNWNNNILMEAANFNPPSNTDELYYRGTPNISWVLSNILDSGFAINYAQPVSNIMFELYFSSVNRYLIWLNDNFIAVKQKGTKLTSTKKKTFSGKLNLED